MAPFVRSSSNPQPPQVNFSRMQKVLDVVIHDNTRRLDVICFGTGHSDYADIGISDRSWCRSYLFVTGVCTVVDAVDINDKESIRYPERCDHQYHWHRRCTLTCEYLSKFSGEKNEKDPNVIIRGLGENDSSKGPEAKNLVTLSLF
jgi:hypothetical protein